MSRPINISTLKQITDSVYEELYAKHISEAHDKLSVLVQYSQDSQIRADFEELRVNYCAMLNFLTGGGSDDNRATIQARMLQRSWEMLTRVRRDVRMRTGSDTYSKTATKLAQDGNDARSLMQQWTSTLPSEERFTLQDTIFDYLWTSPLWSNTETALWHKFIQRQDYMVQQHLLGALMLAVWEFPDLEKLSVITLMAESENKRTRLTAITALVFINQQYGHELEELAGYSPGTLCTTLRPTVMAVQKEFVLMLASKVSFEHEQDIINNLPKDDTATAIREAMNIKLDFVKRRLASGLDPNFSRMSTLHSCRFLSICSHWFLPFDTSHPLVQSIIMGNDGKENKALNKMAEVITDCDIDKYAMCEMIGSNKQLAQSLSEQLEQAGMAPQDTKQPDITLRHIVQNLYRFFTQSHVSRDVRNPFASYQLLINQQRFRTNDGESIYLDCAKILYDAKEYDAALLLLDSMMQQYGASQALLKLKAKCYQQAGKDQEAYSCYTQAMFLDEDDWYMMNILVLCCEKLGKRKEMYHWLDKLLEKNPDDKRLLLRKAESLEEDGRWNDALQLYHRISYLRPTDAEAIVDIVRGEFMTCNVDAIKKYITKIEGLESNLTWTITMLRADLCFIQNNWKAAKAYYTTALYTFLDEGEFTIDDFRYSFERHRDMIKANGISNDDINLMWDAIWTSYIHGTRQTLGSQRHEAHTNPYTPAPVHPLRSSMAHAGHCRTRFMYRRRTGTALYRAD